MEIAFNNIFREAFAGFNKPAQKSEAGEQKPVKHGAHAPKKVYRAHTQELAQKIDLVYACSRIIAENIAKCPIIYERWDNQKQCYTSMEDSAAWQTVRALNIQPNKRENAFMFWTSAIYRAIFKGTAVIVWETDNLGHPTAFYNVGSMDSFWSYNEQSNEFVITGGRYCPINGTLSADKVILIKGRAKEGTLLGQPILSFAEDNLAISRTATHNTLDTFAKNGVGKYMLHNTTEDSTAFNPEMTPEQMEDIRDDIQNQLNADYDIIIKDGPGKLESMQLSQEQLQALAKTERNDYAIVRFFNVPPIKVGLKGDRTYHSEEEANIQLYQECLEPWMTQIQQELAAKLIVASQFSWNQYQFRHNTKPLYLMSKKDEAKYYADMIAAGLCSPAEARYECNRPWIEGTDVPLMSANLKTLEALKAENNKNNQPTTDNNGK